MNFGSRVMLFAMKIYVSHLRDFDFDNELYKPLRESALNVEHDFFLPHEGERSVNSKEDIKSCDLILAEVSSTGTGQGIELGWADMLNIPILCVHKEGSKIPSSLKYLTQDFISYTDESDLIEKLTSFLS